MNDQRVAICQAVAKAIAYKVAGKQALAEQWAVEAAKLLRAAIF
jgi:hypothetical protein